MLILEEYNFRYQQQREEAITQAYMTAYFYRVNKMPPLKRVLEKSRPKQPVKPQTPEQMLAVAKRWHMRLERGEE